MVWGKINLIEIEKYFNSHPEVSKYNWTFIPQLNFTVARTEEEFKEKVKLYNNIAPFEQGIYVFYNSNGECLYVGESKRLRKSDTRSRIADRYYETNYRKSGPGWEKPAMFFNKNQDDNMLIAFTKIANINRRLIIEREMTVYLKPKYIYEKLLDDN